MASSGIFQFEHHICSSSLSMRKTRETLLAWQFENRVSLCNSKGDLRVWLVVEYFNLERI